MSCCEDYSRIPTDELIAVMELVAKSLSSDPLQGQINRSLIAMHSVLRRAENAIIDCIFYNTGLPRPDAEKEMDSALGYAVQIPDGCPDQEWLYFLKLAKKVRQFESAEIAELRKECAA